MPFIPHSETDVQQMLKSIGADSIEALFDEIPEALKAQGLTQVPEGLPEWQVAALMSERAAQDHFKHSFIGAGAYEHHIPAAVWQITTRGEFYSAYTPYQAEASQGSLQVFYEYQSMMCALTGMDVSNASLYDGASGLGEAILMAVRAKGDQGEAKVLVPTTVHPFYREVAHNCTFAQGIEQVALPMSGITGISDVSALKEYEGQGYTAVVIQQPNFFGNLEAVDALTDWAHAQGALVIAVVNPTSLAILKPPSEWGAKGADIVCGDGQPLGSPLSSGGPYFGFLTCKKEFVRQMPGRIIGRTLDMDGKPGFTLTLQAREQHIRRAKATSNICTNQGLLVTAGTIYMSLLGPQGLAQVAEASASHTARLVALLTASGKVKKAFTSAHFHECLLLLDRPVAPVLAALAEQGILGGYDVSRHYPDLGHALLVCCTETKTEAALQAYATALSAVLA
jgi:glycine dehydrogenase subunit 1